ncbi:hypothetical protein AAVH_29477 [Aphelenchoides avenae]|nr:hypothetical protein AAVH_29477 [Aphelenchus avenae]
MNATEIDYNVVGNDEIRTSDKSNNGELRNTGGRKPNWRERQAAQIVQAENDQKKELAMQSAARKNKALAYYALADKVSIPADMDWWTACKLVSEKGPKVDKNAKAIISDIGGNYRTAMQNYLRARATSFRDNTVFNSQTQVPMPASRPTDSGESTDSEVDHDLKESASLSTCEDERTDEGDSDSTSPDLKDELYKFSLALEKQEKQDKLGSDAQKVLTNFAQVREILHETHKQCEADLRTVVSQYATYRGMINRFEHLLLRASDALATHELRETVLTKEIERLQDDLAAKTNPDLGDKSMIDGGASTNQSVPTAELDEDNETCRLEKDASIKSASGVLDSLRSEIASLELKRAFLINELSTCTLMPAFQARVKRKESELQEAQTAGEKVGNELAACRVRISEVEGRLREAESEVSEIASNENFKKALNKARLLMETVDRESDANAEDSADVQTGVDSQQKALKRSILDTSPSHEPHSIAKKRVVGDVPVVTSAPSVNEVTTDHLTTKTQVATDANLEVLEIPLEAPAKGVLTRFVAVGAKITRLTEDCVPALKKAGIHFMDHEEFEAISADDLDARAAWCKDHEPEFNKALDIIVAKKKEGLLER